MKKSKIIVPALGIIAFATAASITGTVAWFTANGRVTVNGMSFSTQVSNNIMIASTNDVADESQYTNELTQSVSGVLEPVSTIDGLAFFYTVAGKANGSATVVADGNDFKAYDQAQFRTDYAVNTAVGYVDYVFYVKATAKEDATIKMTKCNLLYDGGVVSDKAWRVAVFAQDATKGSNVATALADSNRKTILSLSGAKYFETNAVAHTVQDGDLTAGDDVTSYYTTNYCESNATGTAVAGVTYWEKSGDVTPKAVSGLDARAAVKDLGEDAEIKAVTAGNTVYQKVTVRVWLEGEDTTCTNDTYAPLTEDYSLDLEIKMDDSTAVSVIGSATV